MKAGTICLLVSLCYPDPTIQAVQSPARKLMMCRARGWLAKIIGKLSQSLLLLATQTLWLSIRGAQETWVLAVPLLLLTENKRLYLSTSLSVPFFFAASFGHSGRAVKVDLKRILSFYVLFVAKYLDNLEPFFKLYLNMSEKALKKQPTNKQD